MRGRLFERLDVHSSPFFLSPTLTSWFGYIMASPRTSLSLARHLRPHLRLNELACSLCRGLATAAVDSPTLPLAGIRVLDMTRVLAGVRLP